MYTRRAAERIDFQTGIVGEQISIRQSPVKLRLDRSVLLKRGSILFRRGHGAGKQAHIEIGRGELKLAELSRIRRGAVDRH